MEQLQGIDTTTKDTQILEMAEIEPVAEAASNLLPLEPITAEFDMADADEWLADLENFVDDWPNDPGTVGSDPTSAATNPVRLEGTYSRDIPQRERAYTSANRSTPAHGVSFISKDIISLRILNPHSDRKVSIFNIYNEVGTDTLLMLGEAIKVLDPTKETIVPRDFNLHHSLWSSTHQRTGNRPSAQELLAIIEECQLQLLTEPRTPTHRWKDRESTINLTFTTEGVTSLCDPLQDQ
ncbi:hypothetical protein LOZ58_006901 [Ophidiomyces ophidiicola]|nr:hypothetical protein LOZ58_006901 [Ophidiomyces ophidiicola]